jgi:predicted kinase
MNNLILIRGAPGSGKSTLAKSLGILHIETDMFRYDPYGTYSYKADEDITKHTYCLELTRAAIRNTSVVVSNSFTRLWEIAPYLTITAKITIVHCERTEPNIHNVPMDVVESMRYCYEPHDCDISVEEFQERWKYYGLGNK